MKPFILIIALCLFFSNCEKDKFVEKIGMVQIDNFSISDTVLQNENVTIAIKASANNGCWSDLYAVFNKEDIYEYSIKAYGTFSCNEGGCTCPTVMVYHDTTINFLPNQEGTYLIQIQMNRNTTVTDTLIVK